MTPSHSYVFNYCQSVISIPKFNKVKLHWCELIGPLQLVMVENSHGYMYIMGPFHSTKTSGLNFWQLPVANGTAFSKISKPDENLARYTQIFENAFSRKFPFHSTLLPEFPEFSVEWFAFRKFNSFQNFWKLFRKFLHHCRCFQIFKSFG